MSKEHIKTGRELNRRDREVSECELCGHEVTPKNIMVEYHICRECLATDVQVGDRL